MQTMRLVEAAKGFYQSIFEKRRVIKTERRKPIYLTFPDAKKDFSSGAFGMTGFDLSNAFAQEVIQTGDLLHVVAKNLKDPENPTYDIREVIYLEPDPALFGSTGLHRLWEIHAAGAEIDLPRVTTQGNILSWRKIGTAPRDELEKIVEAYKGFYLEKGQKSLTFPTY